MPSRRETALVRLELELSKLNTEQRRAVTTNNPRVLTIAPAGSGKTKCLTLRVARLMINGCPGDRILCVTFTRAAAAEMRERVESTLADCDPGGSYTMPTIRTLHSWGASLIRRYAHFFDLTRDFTIYDEVDKADVIRACARDLGQEKWDRSKVATLWKSQRVQALYRERLRQSNAVDYDQIESMTLKLLADNPDVAERWIGYFSHVLVDEYQDTNLAQVLIVNRLLAGSTFIVGDPRQSIYRFRGAEPKTIIEHAQDADFEVVQLVNNYRSHPEIIDVANRCVLGDWPDMVAARTSQSTEKPCLLSVLDLMTSDPSQPIPRVSAHVGDNEPRMVAKLIGDCLALGYQHGDIAVLARTWSVLRAVRNRLELDEIPHKYHGDEDDPWATNDGRALARVLLLLLNPADDNLAALLAEWGTIGRRRFEHPRMLRAEAIESRRPLMQVLGLHDDQWARLLLVGNGQGRDAYEAAVKCLDALEVLDTYRHHDLATRVDTLAALVGELGRRAFTLETFRDWWVGRATAEKILEAKGQKAVQLMTVHASKGLEYPVIILADCRDGVYPSTRSTSTIDDKNEDMRLLYVAVTRARDRLAVTCPTMYQAPWTQWPIDAIPSPYFAEAIAPRGFVEVAP